MLDIEPLDAGGVIVNNADLARPTCETQDQELASLFERYGLIVFRDQNLTKQQFLDATSSFGGLGGQPAVAYPEDQYPGLSIISTRGVHGDATPTSEERLVGEVGWHTDQGYVTAPNRGKLLYAVEVPEKGGLTGFIDGERTYEGLPKHIKEQLQDLHVVQSWGHAQSVRARLSRYRSDGERRDPREFPDVSYPMVYDHPRTGRKVLNAPPLWSSGIVEMPGESGQELLALVIEHITQSRYAYWHRYLPGDLVAWDNWRFLHAAGGTEPRYRRTLWSAAIRGGPEFGRSLNS